MDYLSERLKALGFKPAVAITREQQPRQFSLEESVGGAVIENSVGSFVLKETNYPQDYRHGSISFRNNVSMGRINQAARISAEQPRLSSLLFIDTETSGLSVNSGTFAFLVGVGRFDDEGFHLQQFIIRDPSEEKALLLHLSNIFRPDTVFVTFNGKSFDIPLLQSRMIINKLPARFRDNLHMDILHLSRKLWRNQLESCALKDLETAILHLERTTEDVPGWMIPDIYFEYLRTGDPQKISDVIYHNAQDIVSLAALFLHISDLLESQSLENIATEDLIAISRIYTEINAPELAEKTLQICHQRRLASDQKKRVSILLGNHFKNRGDPIQAVEYWKEASEKNDVNSCIELAKYYEHKCRDVQTALVWARKAGMIVNENLTDQNMKHLASLIEKRISRLERKRAKNVQAQD